MDPVLLHLPLMRYMCLNQPYKNIMPNTNGSLATKDKVVSTFLFMSTLAANTVTLTDINFSKSFNHYPYEWLRFLTCGNRLKTLKGIEIHLSNKFFCRLYSTQQ